MRARLLCLGPCRLAVLYSLAVFGGSATVAVTEDEATVLWGMWQHRLETDDTIAADEALGRVNDERDQYGRLPIKTKAFEAILGNLVALGCTEKTADGKRWHLCEKVKVGRPK